MNLARYHDPTTSPACWVWRSRHLQIAKGSPGQRLATNLNVRQLRKSKVSMKQNFKRWIICQTCLIAQLYQGIPTSSNFCCWHPLFVVNISLLAGVKAYFCMFAYLQCINIYIYTVFLMHASILMAKKTDGWLNPRFAVKHAKRFIVSRTCWTTIGAR